MRHDKNILKTRSYPAVVFQLIKLVFKTVFSFFLCILNSCLKQMFHTVFLSIFLTDCLTF